MEDTSTTKKATNICSPHFHEKRNQDSLLIRINDYDVRKGRILAFMRTKFQEDTNQISKKSYKPKKGICTFII